MKTLGFTILVFLISGSTAFSDNSPEFIQTSEGLVVSDVNRAFSSELAFPWNTDPFVKIPGNITRIDDEAEMDNILQATLLEGKNPTAVVNERLVKVGDEVNGRIVRSIGQDYVLLEKGGSIIELGLYEENSSATPSANRAPAQVISEPEIRIEEIKP